MHLCQHSGRLLIPVSKKVFGFWSVQLRTTAVASSLSRNILPLSGPKKWWANEATSGLYGGWGSTSRFSFRAVSSVKAAVWGRALSWRKQSESFGFLRFQVVHNFLTLPTLIPVSYESSRTVTRRLSRISSSILTTLVGVTEVLGLRAWGLFSARSRLL
jgi:hypothetical protein